MTENKQISIYDLLPLLRKGLVAMDEDGTWYWYKKMPQIYVYRWFLRGHERKSLKMLNIAPFDGDWKDSLMECGK